MKRNDLITEDNRSLMCFIRFIIILSTLLVTPACVTILSSPIEHCSLTSEGDWKEMEEWPANRQELLKLVEGESLSRFQEVADSGEFIEAWLVDSNGSIGICRYENIADSCKSRTYWVRFMKLDGKWHAGSIMEKICMYHPKRY